ncbi:MAG: transcriptional regulator [Planctomycetaceae bacterium]
MGRFVENLLVIMSKQKLTQARVAELTGVPVSNLNRIIKGKERITVDRAERIAHALGKDIQEFFKIPRQSA